MLEVGCSTKSIYELCLVIALNWVDMRGGFGYTTVIRHFANRLLIQQK